MGCDEPSKTLEQANACKVQLSESIQKRDEAIHGAWEIFKDPASLASYVSFEQVRDDVANRKDASLRATDHMYSATSTLDPGSKKWVTSAVRTFLSHPARFTVFSKQLRERAVTEIRKASASGAVQTLLETTKPVLEKPLDPLLAQQGMQWVYDVRCFAQEISDAQKKICAAAPFPKAFKEHYGIDATRDTVWTMGFLLRRWLENRALVALWQRELLEGLKDLGAQ